MRVLFEGQKIELNDEVLKEIYKVSRDVFCDGIYVACEHHVSGYDFISFENVEEDEILSYQFENIDISNGVFCSHPYEGKTLKEILLLSECRFNFEK